MQRTVQMYRLSFPLVVRIWHKLAFWREIKTPAHLRHCRDSSKVISLHLGPAMSPESPAPREPGIQMTGAKELGSIILVSFSISCHRFVCTHVLGAYRPVSFSSTFFLILPLMSSRTFSVVPGKCKNEKEEAQTNWIN